ncbi:MAG: 3-hydroxyacyl-CoA dehydrogenase family protein, partial [Gemmataceae bacterium]
RLVRQQLGRPAEPGGVFERMKDRGWLGQKAGVGFYTHAKGKARPHSAAEELVREGKQGPSLSANLPEAARLAEARERMVLLMVNEAAAVLADGLADAATIDLAIVFGTGWAPHRGGPLKYADDRGLADVVRALEQLTSRHGPRFAPSPGLRRRAGEAGAGS